MESSEFEVHGKWRSRLQRRRCRRRRTKTRLSAGAIMRTMLTGERISAALPSKYELRVHKSTIPPTHTRADPRVAKSGLCACTASSRAFERSGMVHAALEYGQLALIGAPCAPPTYRRSSPHQQKPFFDKYCQRFDAIVSVHPTIFARQKPEINIFAPLRKHSSARRLLKIHQQILGL